MSGRHNGGDSVLRAWDSKSSVRSKPRKLVQELEVGKVLFPRPLAPIVEHEDVRRRGDGMSNLLLNLRLYLYLDFTTALEQEVVNPVLADVARGVADVELS